MAGFIVYNLAAGGNPKPSKVDDLPAPVRVLRWLCGRLHASNTHLQARLSGLLRSVSAGGRGVGTDART
eukprot:scaffold1875_cov339-Prasinococcus_capsulatus_cf.AAC.18